MTIVVVEGISAAGKTTWCRTHYPEQTTWESPPAAAPVSRDTDPEEAARYWLERNAERWAAAVEIERRCGIAICDTDPLKLHYAWSLHAIGELPRESWHVEQALTREFVASGRLGFADLVLVNDLPEDVVRQQRNADSTRSRRNFELHVRLAEPLRRWYHALETLSPGRVRWQLPAGPLDQSRLPAPRARREDPVLLDAVLARLG